MKRLYLLICLAITNCQIHAAHGMGQDPEIVADQKELLNLWFEAAKSGNIDVIKKIINNVDINAKDAYENTALLWAVHYGHENIVKLLLETPHIDPNINDGQTTVLCCAVLQPNKEVAKLLLQSPDVDVNAIDFKGDTALKKTILLRNCDMLELLLKSPRIDINMLHWNEDTALQAAVLLDKMAAIKLLLADPRINLNEYQVELTYLENSETSRLLRKKRDEIIAQAFKAIEQHDLVALKKNIGHINIEFKINRNQKFLDILLDKAFSCNSTEIVFLLLRMAKDPRAALARFPFEHASPSTQLFEYFLSLAYCDKFAVKPICKTSQCQICTEPAAQYCSNCKKSLPFEALA